MTDSEAYAFVLYQAGYIAQPDDEDQSLAAHDRNVARRVMKACATVADRWYANVGNVLRKQSFDNAVIEEMLKAPTPPTVGRGMPCSYTDCPPGDPCREAAMQPGGER